MMMMVIMVIRPYLPIVTFIYPLCTHKARTEPESPQHVIISFLWFFVTGATTLCGAQPPPLFRNRKYFRSVVISPTTNAQHGGPKTTLRQAPTI
jgi:hypothetical protein